MADGRKFWLRNRLRVRHPKVLAVWSLALIGNASGQTFGAEDISIRGVFDKTSCVSGAPPSMKIGFSGLAT